MSQVISGTIDQIYTKDVNTRYGDRKVYHAVVNGNDVNLGFKCPYEEGEMVNLDVEVKYGSYQLIQQGSQKKSGNTGAPQPAKAAPANVSNRTSAPAFPIAVNTKDISIIRQSSLNRAIEVVGIMVNTGIFSPANEQELTDKIYELAYQFTDFGSGQREVRQAAAIAAYDEE